MKRLLNQPVLSYAGKPMVNKEPDGKGGLVDVEITFRDVISTAVNNFKQEENPTNGDKAKSYRISLKIWGAKKEVDLTADEAAYCVQRVNAYFKDPILCGRVEELLNTDPDSKKAKDAAKEETAEPADVAAEA